MFYPTGNENADLKYIYDFYRKNSGPKSDDKFAGTRNLGTKNTEQRTRTKNKNKEQKRALDAKH